jgi:hypothetical protein
MIAGTIGAALAALLISIAPGSKHPTAIFPETPATCSIFVGPSGSPSATGRRPDAPTTLERALKRVNPGDVVCFNQGRYDFATSYDFLRSGSASAWITYRSWNGPVTITYTGSGSDGYHGMFRTKFCDPTPPDPGPDCAAHPWSGGHYLIFDGLGFDLGNRVGSAIKTGWGSHHVIARNNTIRNTGAACLSFSAADYTLAEHNTCYLFGYDATTSWSSGLNLWYGGGANAPVYGGGPSNPKGAWFDSYPGFHNVYVRNVVAGGNDISTHCSDGNGFIIDGGTDVPPVLFANNVVYQNGGRGIDLNRPAGSIWIVNNTFYDNGLDLRIASNGACANGKADELFASDIAGLHLLNNLAFARTSSGYLDGYTYQMAQSSAAVGPNLSYNGTIRGISAGQFLQANPLFADAPPLSSSCCHALEPAALGTRLTLSAASPAINAGADPRADPSLDPSLRGDLERYLALDAAGGPRTKGGAVDLGAYESG